MFSRIALICPPWYFLEEVEYLSQNLAAGYLASWLLKEGHQVRVVDALTEGSDIVTEVDTGTIRGIIKRVGLQYEAISERIPTDTEIIGITAPFTNHAKIIKELAPVIKRAHPDAKIVVGGIYPSTMPGKSLTDGVDYVVKGEGELPLSALARGDNPREIKGVWFRDASGKVVDGGTSDMVENLDDIPHPARHLLPMEKYFTLSSRSVVKTRAATVFTSRGCPFDCSFCSIHPVYGRKWRARSPENVLDELRQLKENFGVEHIEFEDDNLTLDISRAEAIFDGMTGMGLTWCCSNGIRVDKLNESLLVKMKAAGCSTLALAIEHGDPEMLEMMNKKLSREKIIEVTEICFKLGIPTIGFFIFCHPGETKKHFNRGLKFAMELKKRGMKGCGVHLAQAYPGTRLYKMCEENGWLIYPDTEDRLHFPGDVYIQTPDFDEAEVIRRMEIAKTYLGFPGYKEPQTLLDKVKEWLMSVLPWKGFLKIVPAKMKTDLMTGFYDVERTPEGRSFQWSKPRAIIKLDGLNTRIGTLKISFISPFEKHLKIIVNGVIIYDDIACEGENLLIFDLGKSVPENGVLNIQFITPATNPMLTGIGAKEDRDLGILIWWLQVLP